MLSYRRFSWIYKTAGDAGGNPWQVSGGKWHAHSSPGDPSSPIIEVNPQAAVGSGRDRTQQMNSVASRNAVSEAVTDRLANISEYLETGKVPQRFKTPPSIDVSGMDPKEASKQISLWLSTMRNRPTGGKSSLTPEQKTKLADSLAESVSHMLSDIDAAGLSGVGSDRAKDLAGRMLSKLPISSKIKNETTSGGYEPSPEEREEAQQKAEVDARKKAQARDWRRRPKPGIEDDKYGD